MEADFGEVRLCHLEDVVAVGKEDISAFFVGCHELMFPLLEGFEGGFVVTLNPAGFI